jgi:hypothetical protein
MLDIKRKPEEIIAMYSIDNELFDVYVEGPTDKLIIENYLEYKKLNKTVIEIDTIDFLETQIEFNDLQLKSNKDKLIALSRILSQNKINAKIKCIVDRDFDGIFNSLETNSFLFYTDYACIESYLLCKKHLKKIFEIGIRNFPHQIEKILKEISKVLFGLFILRLVKIKFELDCKIPKINNIIIVNKGTGICNFNLNQFIEIYINTNRLTHLREDIHSYIRSASKLFPKDIRYCMNGHDFMEVLFNYINKIKNTPNFRLENFERAMLLAIQPNYLEDHSLFQGLEI